MKVKAKKMGFYGKLRREGDEFTIKSKEDLGTWMEVIETKKAK